jgi:hypothetical protein
MDPDPVMDPDPAPDLALNLTKTIKKFYNLIITGMALKKHPSNTYLGKVCF